MKAENRKALEGDFKAEDNGCSEFGIVFSVLASICCANNVEVKLWNLGSSVAALAVFISEAKRIKTKVNKWGLFIVILRRVMSNE
jgi:hypothetical protein